MEQDSIKISENKMMAGVLLFFIVAGLVFKDFFFANTVNAVILFSLVLISLAAAYAYLQSRKLNEMCCMMNGMAFGMIPSFYLGTLFALSTGDFVLGAIVGTFIGLVLGIPLGRAGGNLGRLEGVMASPMGALMGSMTGIMIKAYNVQLFMQFFFVLLVFLLYEVTRMNYHAAEKQISKTMLYTGVALALIAGLVVFLVPVSLETQAKSDVAPLVLAKNGIQEIDLRLEAVKYSPNSFTVKKGVPVRLNLKADANAGCTRDFVFPAFSVRKLVDRGGSSVIEFTPQQEGKFQFRCSMGMATGTMLVV